MRIFRRLIVALFIVSLALYVGVDIWEARTTDTDGPALTSDVETLELSVTDPEETLLSGLTASDEKDGDLTDNILISGKSFFTEPGVLTVDYVVFDSDNNFASLSRKVCYTDYTSPEFSVEGSLYFVRSSSISVVDSITATDVLDGDISDQISLVSSEVDSDQAGTYAITIEVTNSYGDRVEADAYVIVGSSSTQTGLILNNTFFYLDPGESFTASDAISGFVSPKTGESLSVLGMTVYEDGGAAYTITTKGTVDTSTPGCYLVEYIWTDGEDESGSVWLSVIVRDN